MRVCVCSRASGAQECAREPDSADFAVAIIAPGGQLVLGRRDRLGAVGPFTGEVSDGSGEFAHGPADRDAEYALAAPQQVDDFLGRGEVVDGGAVGEQGDVGKVLDAALAQVVDGDADVMQRDTGVQQAFDDLEDQDVR